MATQNPIESEGTYPLPEAQLDRFMLKILIDYPEHDEELTIVQRQLVPHAGAARRRSRSTTCRQLQRAVFDGVRRSRARQLRGRARGRDAQAGRARPRRPRRLHLVRREPARADQRRAGGARARAHPRPRLRARPTTSARSRRTRSATGSCSATRRSPRSVTPDHDPRLACSPRCPCRRSTLSRSAA